MQHGSHAIRMHVYPARYYKSNLTSVQEEQRGGAHPVG